MASYRPNQLQRERASEVCSYCVIVITGALADGEQVFTVYGPLTAHRAEALRERNPATHLVVRLVPDPDED